MLKAYLSAQASSLSAFVISKTHVSGQKSHARQLNTKVCSSKSVFQCNTATTVGLQYAMQEHAGQLAATWVFLTTMRTMTSTYSTKYIQIELFNDYHVLPGSCLPLHAIYTF